MPKTTKSKSTPKSKSAKKEKDTKTKVKTTAKTKTKRSTGAKTDTKAKSTTKKTKKTTTTAMATPKTESKKTTKAKKVAAKPSKSKKETTAITSNSSNSNSKKNESKKQIQESKYNAYQTFLVIVGLIVVSIAAYIALTNFNEQAFTTPTKPKYIEPNPVSIKEVKKAVGVTEEQTHMLVIDNSTYKFTFPLPYEIREISSQSVTLYKSYNGEKVSIDISLTKEDYPEYRQVAMNDEEYQNMLLETKQQNIDYMPIKVMTTKQGKVYSYTESTIKSEVQHRDYLFIIDSNKVLYISTDKNIDQVEVEDIIDSFEETSTAN